MNLHLFDLVTVCKALLPIIPKHPEFTRYWQRGMHIYTRGNSALVLEVTDGHRAARVVMDVDASSETFDRIIDREAVESLAKTKVRKTDTTTVTLEVDEPGNVRVNGNVTSQILDARFPDMDRVFDPAPTCTPIGDTLELGCNAVYMADLFKSAAMLAHPKYQAVLVKAQSATQPVRIEVPTNHGTFARLSLPAQFIVMPVRI